MTAIAIILLIATIGATVLFLRTMKTTQGFVAPESSAKKNIHLVTYHRSKEE